MEFSKAIEINPDYIKPRYERLLISKKEEEYDQALEDAKKILELDPHYPKINHTINELERLHKEKFEKMKNEVFSGLKNLGNMFLKPFGIDVNNFKMNQNQDGTYNMNYQNGQ